MENEKIKKFKDIFAEIEEKVKLNFKQFDEVMPVAMVFGKNGQVIMPLVGKAFENRRDAFKQFGQRANKQEFEVEFIIFVSEAWASILSKEEVRKIDVGEAEQPIPSQDPNRKEMLQIIGMNSEGDTLFKTFEIVDRKEKILKDFESAKEVSSMDDNILQEFWIGYMGVPIKTKILE